MKIDVLDKGYIEVVDTLGDDLTPVNAARVEIQEYARALKKIMLDAFPETTKLWSETYW
jgi:hypothetical protein